MAHSEGFSNLTLQTVIYYALLFIFKYGLYKHLSVCYKWCYIYD